MRVTRARAAARRAGRGIQARAALCVMSAQPDKRVAQSGVSLAHGGTQHSSVSLHSVVSIRPSG